MSETSVDRWVEQRRRALKGNPSEFARGYEAALDDFEDRQGEAQTVVWDGALGDTWRIEVDPHSGVVRINEREFDVSTLSSDDVDPRMYRSLDTGTDREGRR